MITTLSSFIYFKLYIDCQNQNRMRFFFDEIKQNQFFFDKMKQNWIFFHEMRQNQIFFHEMRQNRKQKQS